MKIAFIRYPRILYKTGRVIRGGSEIANQIIIDGLRQNNVEVVEFEPKGKDRLQLVDLPGIGTPLMFQDLNRYVKEINKCDLLVTTNWFGAIIPDLEIPQITLFHSNASWVIDSIKKENIDDKSLLAKWITIGRKYNLARESKQTLHEKVIAIEDKYFAKHSSRIVAVSEALKDSLVKYYDIDPNNISVINNAYPDDWKQIKLDKSGPISMIAFTRMPGDYNGFVGKGADRIFEVMRDIADIEKEIIFSSGKDSYKKLIAENLKNVRLIENADRVTVGRELSGSHISIHTSRCEACQMTLIEAMLMQTVPISFPVGIAPEIIKNGENGFIVNSVDEMISKINLLKNNRALIQSMSERAVASVKDKFSANKIAQQYRKLFKKTIEGSKN